MLKLPAARLVAVKQGNVKANQCLTLLPSSSTTAYSYFHLATCGSNVTPPASQDFFLDNVSGVDLFYVSPARPTQP